ncbi:ABC transporter permease [Aestuariirhabdus sp. LZHN29]|uniref:ABC transporter permease n=1 Tax=Aestuariirhabdus sp. LZHN29 TaxID=3417462 RepID=UPI003CF2B510
MKPADAWIAFITIAIKEVRRFLRIWPQTLLPPAITMVLYFVIFGSVIGSRIGEMGGFSYMEYVVPGLIMMSVITNSYGNVASSFYSNKFQRSVEEILVSPVPDYLMLAGFVSGGVIRGLLVGTIVTLLSLNFTSLPMHSVGITMVAVILTSVLFSLGGFINALYANSFDDISIIPTFVLTPLTYLGGVFYSVNVLPDFWAGLSHLNPILYMVNTFRYGILGYSDGVPVLEALSFLSLLTVIAFCFTLFLLRRGTGLRH